MRHRMSYRIMVAILFSAALALGARAQTYTKLVDFDGTNGGKPGYGSLVQGIDGNLYGTTSTGGSGNAGTVFSLTPIGTLTTVYNFCSLSACADGSTPEGGLTLGPDGSLYGTTSARGPNGGGTIYKIATNGTFSTFYAFCQKAQCADGSSPYAPPVLAFDGNFYGTTLDGTIYRLTPAGKLTTIYNFCPGQNCGTAGAPQGGLAEGYDRNFYGTTRGGCCGAGTVFRIAPSGTLTSLATLGSPIAGSDPQATMTIGRDGNAYGITYQQDTVFKTVLAGGATAQVVDLCAGATCPYGNLASGALELGTDGNFYGTAQIGVLTNAGTIFRVTPIGTAKLLHQFSGSNGSDPFGGLFQSTNGDFYGAATFGGPNKTCTNSAPPTCGTLFRFSMKFGPFVRTAQRGAHVGDTIIILGYGLTGSTGVTFNGTTTTFTVVSDTEVTATVPTGATTGTLKVVTPGGTLSSNRVFQIL